MTTKRTPSIAAQVARLRELTVAELVPEYQRLHGKPPRSRHRDWLWRRCAWKLQENAFGGLSEVAKRRLDELVAEIELPAAAPNGTRRSGSAAARRPEVPPGTTIVRRWRGRELRLAARDDGTFEVEGVVYESLSAAARGVTGAKWNGRLFWLGKSGGSGG